MIAIFKREFKAYFTSPVGYVFIAACILLSGLFFYAFTLSIGSTDLSDVFSVMFFVLLIFIPILTMRLMSDEKKQKTDQLILTSPVSLSQLVLGKFLSAYCILIIGTIVLPIYGIVLSFFAEMSWSSLFGNYVGIMLLGGVYIALGLLVSTLTENQMIAAVASLFTNFILYLLDALAAIVPIGFISGLISSLSLYSRFNPFIYGIFSFSNVLFFLSFMFMFLFITVRILDKRRWG